MEEKDDVDYLSQFKRKTRPADALITKELMGREHQIAIENMAIIRERLQHCVRSEGVNQFTNCKELREKYFALCTDRYNGMIFPAGFEIKSRQVPGLVKK